MLSIQKILHDFGWSSFPLTEIGGNYYKTYGAYAANDTHKAMLMVDAFIGEQAKLDQVMVFDRDHKNRKPIPMIVYDYSPLSI